MEKRIILIVSFPDCIQVASGKKDGKPGGKATKDSRSSTHRWKEEPDCKFLKGTLILVKKFLILMKSEENEKEVQGHNQSPSSV